jgi:hypothetical protein
MRLQAVPDDQQLLADRALQCLEELDDLRALDRTLRGQSAQQPPASDRNLIFTAAGGQNGQPVRL